MLAPRSMAKSLVVGTVSQFVTDIGAEGCVDPAEIATRSRMAVKVEVAGAASKAVGGGAASVAASVTVGSAGTEGEGERRESIANSIPHHVTEHAAQGLATLLRDSMQIALAVEAVQRYVRHHYTRFD